MNFLKWYVFSALTVFSAGEVPSCINQHINLSLAGDSRVQ
jgi:hypothetical protein